MPGSFVVTVDDFRLMTLSVLPFCQPDHQAMVLGGVRYATVDDDVVIAETMSNRGGAHFRVADLDPHRPDDSDGLDVVIAHGQVATILATIDTLATLGSTRIVDVAVEQPAGADRGVVVTLGSQAGNGHEFVIDADATVTFPFAKSMRDALNEDRESRAELKVNADTLRYVMKSLPTSGQPLVIHPGLRSHIVTAGDSFIAIIPADLGVRSHRLPGGGNRDVSTIPPPTTDLQTWRARF